MKKSILLSVLVWCCYTGLVSSQVRKEIQIPNLPGYLTLKCDFHMHSVFSDGQVWPTVRVTEAYTEGLDAIAITEHIEYRPHHKSKDMQGDHNRSFEIAGKSGEGLDILVIHGSEITRSMPPGHWNALFLQDSNPLDTPEYKDAFKEAAKQKAFMFWNHPGWYRQADDTTVWYEEHTRLYNEGYMHGIEVVNGGEYYPEAHQWALDKNLTMLGNTDAHAPLTASINPVLGEKRSMTLVFAKERTLEGIREALDSRRTAVWYNDLVIGREDILKELLKGSIKIESIKRTKSRITVVLKNDSDFTLFLKKKEHDPNLQYFREMIIKPHERRSIQVNCIKPVEGKAYLDFVIENFYAKPNTGLPFQLEI